MNPDLQKCIALMNKPDHTSKFVALAILPTLLTHQKYNDEQNSDDLVQIAVNILFSFAGFEKIATSKQLSERIPKLLDLLHKEQIRSTVLEILVRGATSPEAVPVYFQHDRLERFWDNILQSGILAGVDRLDEPSTGLQTMTYIILNSSTIPEYADRLKGKLGYIIEKCLQVNPSTLILEFLADILNRIDAELWMYSASQWTDSLYTTLAQITLHHPDGNTRSHLSSIISIILRQQGPLFLFKSPVTPEHKKFALLTVSLSTVNIRSTLPSLSNRLSQYPTLANRLAADYDILTSAIQYLTDDEMDIDFFDPDSLVKLGENLNNAFGDTIEFLRDRWDAARRAASLDTESVQIEWDTPSGIIRDVVTISSIRSLTYWLREDEGLRSQALGIMDILLDVFNEGLDQGIDYRGWVCSGIEGLIMAKNGREIFLKENGWNVIWNDLEKSLVSNADSLDLAECQVRILSLIVEQGDISRDEWISAARFVVGQYAQNPQFQLKHNLVLLSFKIWEKLPRHSKILEKSLKNDLVALGNDVLDQTNISDDCLQNIRKYISS
ncbi:hypothetical protein NEOLI_000407 [Neolecta irregularis DAH-3]|uniref:Uncharacterized protein n=1 Tax=Neolecta irregularis (strain DAH-3) TaxID=1198029 RepID=A0A1U7LUH9_NEOID|nr:hypothetical protein NEOLI_000407 [Neolecta irregularis DAH-3]|eukprot:OLL26330.1 hypothetical protein NEOLI_000407 [Neolecta irregularis DAH-3]